MLQKIKTLPFNIIAQSYQNSQQLQLEELCNGYTAINTGDTLVYVNNVPLKPYPSGHPELSGESYTVAGNFGEVYVGANGAISIAFVAGGAAPQVTIIQKFYLPNNPRIQPEI